ncbi:MAG: hypothetical protein R2939_20735 [Kofleriaceae bacterium]
MLLRAWIGANDDAIGPPAAGEHLALRRGLKWLEPTPFWAPATMTSKPPAASASGSMRRLPSTMRPAYALRAIAAGS